MSAIVAPVEPDRAEIGRWGACFAAILALHAGLLAFLAAQSPPAPTGAIDLPAVVMIDMAPPPAPSAAEPAASPAEPEPAAPDPVPEPEPQPMAALTKPPAPPAPIEAVPPPPPAVKSVVTLPATPKPKALPRPKPPEKVAEKTPPKPVRAAPAPRRAELQARRLPAEPAAARRTASLPGSVAAGSANPAASAASAASWRGQLVAYLQGNLRYPPGSRGGGAASVSFSMNRAGRVLSASLARSAGSPELDAAALDLFRRGALPAPPADVPGATFSFTIPIRFSAR